MANGKKKHLMTKFYEQVINLTTSAATAAQMPDLWKNQYDKQIQP